jgi:hypothetical protein
MIDDLFHKRQLPAPPPGFHTTFWDWVWEMGERLDVRFFDDHPVPSRDVEALISRLGTIHPDLEYYYSQCTPWGIQRDGVGNWTGHLEIARRCAVKNDRLAGTDQTEKNVLDLLSQAPPLWPVHVSQAANAAAFAADQGRLAIVNANIGLDLGCPLALGLRNYIMMTVVGEIVWEEKNYPSYNEVLTDELTREAGAWPSDDPPQHPLIDIYEKLAASRVTFQVS